MASFCFSCGDYVLGNKLEESKWLLNCRNPVTHTCPGAALRCALNVDQPFVQSLSQIVVLGAISGLADLGSLPEGIRTAVRNNGGGYANHNLFWTVCAPGGNHSDYSSDALKKALHSSFGRNLNCKDEFCAAAASRFGSGWAWLEAAGDGSLSITSTPNQDSPLMEGRIPILGLDVQEHACYLKYQNRRADYIDAFFYVINWTEVTRRYEAATS